jgi:hypothetical protein
MSVRFDDSPRKILILLDVSGSISLEKPIWDFAMNAAADFIKHALPKDALALVTFSRGVLTRTDFNLTREELLVQLGLIAQQRPSSSTKKRQTGLHDTLIEVSGYFDASAAGNVIYLIGDGQDNYSKTQQQRVRDALVNSGIRLFYFSFDKRVQGGSSAIYQIAGAPPVEKFVMNTGGLTIRVPNGHNPYSPEWVRDRIGGSLMAMYQHMSATYVLDVVLPTTPGMRRGWNLQVSDPSLFNKKQDMLFYQAELRSCKSN